MLAYFLPFAGFSSKTYLKLIFKVASNISNKTLLIRITLDTNLNADIDCWCKFLTVNLFKISIHFHIKQGVELNKLIFPLFFWSYLHIYAIF